MSSPAAPTTPLITIDDGSIDSESYAWPHIKEEAQCTEAEKLKAIRRTLELELSSVQGKYPPLDPGRVQSNSEDQPEEEIALDLIVSQLELEPTPTDVESPKAPPRRK